MIKKVYVKSGELEWVGTAADALNAVIKALVKGNDKVLDSDYFYIDERGFRTEDAKWKVPINKGLKAAGYVFDDPASAED